MFVSFLLGAMNGIDPINKGGCFFLKGVVSETMVGFWHDPSEIRTHFGVLLQSNLIAVLYGHSMNDRREQQSSQNQPSFG